MNRQAIETARKLALQAANEAETLCSKAEDEHQPMLSELCDTVEKLAHAVAVLASAQSDVCGDSGG